MLYARCLPMCEGLRSVGCTNWPACGRPMSSQNKQPDGGSGARVSPRPLIAVSNARLSRSSLCKDHHDLIMVLAGNLSGMARLTISRLKIHRVHPHPPIPVRSRRHTGLGQRHGNSRQWRSSNVGSACRHMFGIPNCFCIRQHCLQESQ